MPNLSRHPVILSNERRDSSTSSEWRLFGSLAAFPFLASSPQTSRLSDSPPPRLSRVLLSSRRMREGARTGMAATEQRPIERELGGAAAAAPPAALPAGGPWSPPYRGLSAGLLMTVAGMAFETLAVATVLPETAADLNGLGLYGSVFSAFLLTNLVGIVAAGLLADRDGPATPFVGGILLFVTGLFIGGFAPAMPVLILGRALQGFGAGAVSAVSYVALGR